MSVDQLVCDGTVMGIYQVFDKLKPNLVILKFNDSHDGVAVFFNQGMKNQYPSDNVVQAQSFMFDNSMFSADDNGYFSKTNDLRDVLGNWAIGQDANIIDSDYVPQEVYEVHHESYLIGKEPVKR